MRPPEHHVAAAVDALAAATTPSELETLHRRVRTSVIVARRKAAAKLGPLARAYTEAMEIIDAQKAAGVPFAERVKGLDAVIRQMWPFTREWHELCANCSDHGLAVQRCEGDATCGRKQPHLPHDFGTPCWCALGARFRKSTPAPDDFAQAGKVKKSGFTKAGR